MRAPPRQEVVRRRAAACLAAKAEHLAWRDAIDARREAETRDVIARIEAMRAEVFAAGDGVVPRAMTELEREWRRISRVDPDRGLMDLWARLAPPAWIDRKRWRDTRPDARLDLLVALAADPDGVEAAEAAARVIRPLVRWELTSAACAGSVLDEAPTGDPTSALTAIRTAGYVVVAVDERTITLGCPPLERDANASDLP